MFNPTPTDFALLWNAATLGPDEITQVMHDLATDNPELIDNTGEFVPVVATTSGTVRARY